MAKSDEIIERLDRIERLLSEMSTSFLTLSNKVDAQGGGALPHGGGLFGAVRPDMESQQSDDVESGDLVEVAAEDLVGQFQEQIATVADRDDSAFSLGDVEVDVGASMGADGDKIMLGMNHRRMARPETAARLKFTLRRKTNARFVE